MPKLLSRQKYVPGGFKFWIPAIKFQAAPNASFDVIVNSIIAARKANPHLLAKHGWATDYDTVADELDYFNAKMCADLGYTDYITEGGGGATAPFSQVHHPRSTLQRAAGVVGGAETVVEWIKDGSEAVSPELANKRAAVCVTCPLNQKGDFASFFTVPVADAFRKALNFRRQIKLSTSHDDQIGVCTACDCVIRLKVHLPLSRILAKMPADARDVLDKGCWIRAEALAK